MLEPKQMHKMHIICANGMYYLSLMGTMTKSLLNRSTCLVHVLTRRCLRWASLQRHKHNKEANNTVCNNDNNGSMCRYWQMLIKNLCQTCTASYLTLLRPWNSMTFAGIQSRGLRVYPYPRVYPTRPVPAGSGRVHAPRVRVGSGRCLTGTGLPVFTHEK